MTKEETNELKLKMAQIRTIWPGAVKYTTHYLNTHCAGMSEANQEKEIEKLHSVWNLKNADKLIIDRFADMANELKRVFKTA